MRFIILLMTLLASGIAFGLAGATCEEGSICSCTYQCSGFNESTSNTVDGCRDGSMAPFEWVESLNVTDISDSEFSIGDVVEIEASIKCDSDGDAIGIAYDNGGGWEPVHFERCRKDGMVVARKSLILDGEEGMHAVRAMVAYEGGEGMVCPSDFDPLYADADDVTFLVKERQPRIVIKSPVEGEAVRSEEHYATFSVFDFDASDLEVQISGDKGPDVIRNRTLHYAILRQIPEGENDLVIKATDDSGATISSSVTFQAECIGSWSCTEWSVCEEGLRKRTCELSGCSSEPLPDQEEQCIVPQPEYVGLAFPAILIFCFAGMGMLFFGKLKSIFTRRPKKEEEVLVEPEQPAEVVFEPTEVEGVAISEPAINGDTSIQEADMSILRDIHKELAMTSLPDPLPDVPEVQVDEEKHSEILKRFDNINRMLEKAARK